MEDIAAAGIYVCPTVNVHALTMRELFGDALEKVIMGLYSGGAQIIAGTDAGIDNCAGLIAVRGGRRSDVSALHHVELVAARGSEHRPAPRRLLAAPAGPGPR